MQKITMRLQRKNFQDITNQIKTVEGRINDGKRKTLSVGDSIEFIPMEPDNITHSTESNIFGEIVELFICKTWNELLDHYSIENFGVESRQEYLDIVDKYYTKEEEAEFGVVGIRFKLV